MFPFYGSAMPHVQIYPLRIAEIGNWLCVQAVAWRRSGRSNLRSKMPRANTEAIHAGAAGVANFPERFFASLSMTRSLSSKLFVADVFRSELAVGRTPL